MNSSDRNKHLLREFVEVVWQNRDLSALPEYWTADCVNHAAAVPKNVGLESIRVYHQGFLTGFMTAFTDSKIEYLQQVAEGETVVSQMLFRAIHSGLLFGKPGTGRQVVLSSIRIDRFDNGKIAEHWSVADMAGFMQQFE